MDDPTAVPKAGFAAEPILNAARLSTLRHDLRTPFHQIIGYAEMTGEDADDAGCEAVASLAAVVVSAAHAALGTLIRSLDRDAKDVTPQYLRQLQKSLADPLAALKDGAQRLGESVTIAAEMPQSTNENLDRIGSAIAHLHALVERMATWHVDPQNLDIEKVQVPVAAPLVLTEMETEVARAPDPHSSCILVVDDHSENHQLLRQRLEREGFRVLVAESGEEALQVLGAKIVDLVLLDVLMPGMDGIEVLQRIKQHDDLKKIPVIMISALSEIESVVRCIEGGAEDYLSKPFNPVLLRARIGVTLERKRLRDEEARQHAMLNVTLEELKKERQEAHRLLLNILPERVANELQQGHSAPMYFEDATICFTDFVGFTLSTENMAAEQVVAELHTYFTAFDLVMERYGLEKLKTIGDSYMFASGLPARHPANPVNAILAALELVHETSKLLHRVDTPGWQLRVGLHTGPVVAGVVGIRKFAFDIWGDTVNFASRMESSGAPGLINISERTHARVKDFFQCEHRGKVMTKDKREVDMYFVRGVLPSLIADGTFSAFARRYRLYFNEEPPSFPEFVLSPRPQQV